jgi:small subunit ribosomal protein S14
MAKKSSIENDKKRRRLVQRRKDTRDKWKAIFMNQDLPEDERRNAMFKLAEMPRNSSRVRVRNRCALTGRSRGYYRKFGLSRIMLRDLASKGMLPGVTKASW